MRYFYIHGFNSGPGSRSGAALEQLLARPVIRCHNDYSMPFPECLARLGQFISEKTGNEQACILGTSLGGFYALQLRLSCIARVCAWNPVIFPSLQLARFTGVNTRFTDGSDCVFTREALLSYAQAPDARVWRNFFWNEDTGACEPPERKIFFGVHDDLLDHEVGAAFWQSHARIELIDAGHGIADFSHSLPFIAA